ncbi:MAG: hypothetical protein OXH00_01460 [Candidatus Poribacteria bacterium]|nr:hypothetical protein [Candidatus Poribacteria bacterium]
MFLRKYCVPITVFVVAMCVVTFTIAQNPNRAKAITDALRAMNEAQSGIQGIESIIQDLKRELDEIEVDLSAAKSVFTPFAELWATATSNLEDAEDEFNAAFDAYEAAGNRVDATESHIAGLEADLQYSRDMLFNLDSDNPSSGSQSDYWRQKISDLQADLAMARSELESARAERNRTRSAMRRAARQLPYLRDEERRAEELADKAYKQVGRLEGEKSAKLAEIEAKEAEKAIAEQKYREAEAKYLELKAEQEGDG